MEKMGIDLMKYKEIKDFWSGKRVLLTGHTGFKGSWLSLWLQSLDVELRGIALQPTTSPSMFELGRVAQGMDHQVADIRDYDKIRFLISDFKPEIIIHMAAQPLVRLSYELPIETFATNVMGTVHVLESARRSGSVRAIVNITTDKCYENKEWDWGYREDDPIGGYDPYSSSKGCAELVSSAYRRSFLKSEGIAMATARAGNVIGGGDWSPDRLIPDVLRSLEAKQTIKIRNPNAKRPWQHVLEPLSGYLLLVQKLYEKENDFAESWNFGPRDEDVQPVHWIVDHLCNVWGKKACWEQQPGDHPHEASYLKLDISKAKNRLNWSPKLTLTEALNITTEWHKGYLEGSDVQEMTCAQIASYTKL